MSERKFIGNKDQLLKNIETLERYLTRGNGDEKAFASGLIKNGICFVAYQRGEEWRFAPSRFIGYLGNNLIDHNNAPSRDSKDKHGSYTNKAIINILIHKPIPDKDLEEKYFQYCSVLGIVPPQKARFGTDRKFWKE
jgi:5-methylcytosine-specific restriction protein A